MWLLEGTTKEMNNSHGLINKKMWSIAYKNMLYLLHTINFFYGQLGLNDWEVSLA